MLLSALALAARAGAQLAEPLSAEQVKSQWQQRLDDAHFSARVRMQVSIAGRHEERILEIWRDQTREHGERLFARFGSPADLRGMGLLYLQNEGAPNDYFLFQPATGRVRRVPELMAREDVYGVDLEYLGFGVAQIEPTRVSSVERVELDGRPALRLVETAINRDARFDERVVWLSSETYVPLRTEHHQRGNITLIARTEEIQAIEGIPTPTRVIFERPIDQQRVVMTVDKVDYHSAIPESVFSILGLMKR